MVFFKRYERLLFIYSLNPLLKYWLPGPLLQAPKPLSKGQYLNNKRKEQS